MRDNNEVWPGDKTVKLYAPEEDLKNWEKDLRDGGFSEAQINLIFGTLDVAPRGEARSSAGRDARLAAEDIAGWVKNLSAIGFSIKEISEIVGRINAPPESKEADRRRGSARGVNIEIKN